MIGTIYDGEWTLDKQVVDTARLEVSFDRLKFKVRLPEELLASLCFEEDQFLNDTSKDLKLECIGKPAEIVARDQGYTDNAAYLSFNSTAEKYDGIVLYNLASFTIAIENISYCIHLLSKENGNAVFNEDTGLWTIAITIDSFLVTHQNKETLFERSLPAPVTLIYNAKKKYTTITKVK